MNKSILENFTVYRIFCIFQYFALMSIKYQDENGWLVDSKEAMIKSHSGLDKKNGSKLIGEII